MKTTTIITMAVLLVTSLNLQARTWRVNDTPSADADYTEVQDAIDAATDGDVIQIESGSYPGFSVNKKLTILGTGYEIAEHEDIVTPTGCTYILATINFLPGSEGSYISGVNTCETSSNIDIVASRIIIDRCKVEDVIFVSKKAKGGSSYTNISQISITNSIINDDIGHDMLSNDTLIVTNVSVSNCKIDRITSNTDWSSSSYKKTFTMNFDQCVIADYVEAKNCSFQNCIFTNTYSVYLYTGGWNVLNTDNNNNVNYCYFKIEAHSYSDYHYGTNNLFDQSDFYDSSSNRWKIKDTSSAKTASMTGGEVGIYGGGDPFVPGGYAKQPTITKLLMPANVGNAVEVQVEAKVID